VVYNPTFQSGLLNCVLVSLFLAEHAQHTILSPSKVSVCCVSCIVPSQLVGWWLDLTFLALWADFEAPFLPLVLGLLRMSV